MPVNDDALEALTALAGIVLVTRDLPATLVETCRIAVTAVPGAEGASVTTYPEGRPAAVADTEWARQLDELQYEEQEGPCLDAFRTGTVFRVRDLEQETRWPFYVVQALKQGARSMISLPLTAQGIVVGALNLYSHEPEAFDAESTSLALVVAGHIGLASEVSAAFFRHRDLAEQLADALRSRAVIEQAKGVIMADRRCNADTAFGVLRDMSQRENRKLRDIAQRIVDSVSPA